MLCKGARDIILANTLITQCKRTGRLGKQANIQRSPKRSENWYVQGDCWEIQQLACQPGVGVTEGSSDNTLPTQVVNSA